MYGWSNFLGAMQLEENVNPELYWLDPGSGQFGPKNSGQLIVSLGLVEFLTGWDSLWDMG